MKYYDVHYSITNDGLTVEDSIDVPAKNKEDARDFFLGIVNNPNLQALIVHTKDSKIMFRLKGSTSKVLKVSERKANK